MRVLEGQRGVPGKDLEEPELRISDGEPLGPVPRTVDEVHGPVVAEDPRRLADDEVPETVSVDVARARDGPAEALVLPDPADLDPEGGGVRRVQEGLEVGSPVDHVDGTGRSVGALRGDEEVVGTVS